MAPVLAEVMSGNSVVGWRASVYLLRVNFRLVGVVVTARFPATSLASISAMYLSRSSVLDFVTVL